MTITADALLYAIIAAFGGFLLRYIWDQYIKSKEEKTEKANAFDQVLLEKHINEAICNALEPIKADLIHLSEQINHVEHEFLQTEEQDLQFYKYQLINACKKYLRQGFIYQYQFDNLSDLHRIYNNLHGNSQGDEYYKRAIALPLKPDSELDNELDRSELELFVTDDDMRNLHEKKGDNE